MSINPASSCFLLLIGITVNLVVFSLNHMAGAAVHHGHYPPVPAELDVFELRDIPNTLPVLHSVLLGLLAKAMGSLEWGWMVSHAIVPALIWAVLFWNAYRFVRSGPLALAIAWAVCFIAFSPR